jgi:hypothetical protein
MIASYLCCAMRENERALWRWHHPVPEMGATWMPGTKNESTARWSPLPGALPPWLARMRALRVARGRVDERGFIVPTTWESRRTAGPKPRSLPSGMRVCSADAGADRTPASLPDAVSAAPRPQTPAATSTASTLRHIGRMERRTPCVADS